MLQIIISLIGQLAPAVLILLLILAAIAIWKISRFSKEWEIKSDDVTKLKDQWDANIPDLKSKVNLIYNIVTSDSKVFVKNSPAELTKIGEDLISQIDANKIINKNIIHLKELVYKKKPKNATDLQKECFSIIDKNMMSLLNDSQIDNMNKQADKYGLTIEKAMPIFAILLRDILLKEKKWNKEDIK
jgi:hypothetical protein